MINLTLAAIFCVYFIVRYRQESSLLVAICIAKAIMVLGYPSRPISYLCVFGELYALIKINQMLVPQQTDQTQKAIVYLLPCFMVY